MLLFLGLPLKKMVCGACYKLKALLIGNSGRLPSLPEASAENRRHIVPSGGNPAILVRFQSGPLNTVMYYHNGRAVEVVQKPRTNKITVAMVRDLETRQCYVVNWHALVRMPKVK